MSAIPVIVATPPRSAPRSTRGADEPDAAGFDSALVVAAQAAAPPPRPQQQQATPAVCEAPEPAALPATIEGVAPGNVLVTSGVPPAPGSAVAEIVALLTPVATEALKGEPDAGTSGLQPAGEKNVTTAIPAPELDPIVSAGSMRVLHAESGVTDARATGAKRSASTMLTARPLAAHAPAVAEVAAAETAASAKPAGPSATPTPGQDVAVRPGTVTPATTPAEAGGTRRDAGGSAAHDKDNGRSGRDGEGVSHARVETPATVHAGTAGTTRVADDGAPPVEAKVVTPGADPGLAPEAPRRAGDRVTLRFSGENGVEGQLRVAVRGEAVHATIVASDGNAVRQLEAEIGALRRALADRGFPDVRVAVQTTGGAESSSTTGGHARTRDGDSRDASAEQRRREGAEQRSRQRFREETRRDA